MRHFHRRFAPLFASLLLLAAAGAIGISGGQARTQDETLGSLTAFCDDYVVEPGADPTEEDAEECFDRIRAFWNTACPGTDCTDLMDLAWAADTSFWSSLTSAGQPPGEDGFQGLPIRRIYELPHCDHVLTDDFDPLVFPGESDSSHMHEFFGNDDIAPTSTSETLHDATQGSKHCGDDGDGAAYWVPELTDKDGSGNEELPGTDVRDVIDIHLYYRSYTKSAWPNVTDYQLCQPGQLTFDPPPCNGEDDPGFGMVTPWPNEYPHYGWSCIPSEQDQDGEPITYAQIPQCKGANFKLIVNFPDCWNGDPLDPANPQDHMAYRASKKQDACPGTHTYRIPEVSFFVRYEAVTQGYKDDSWWLSSDTDMADCDLQTECMKAAHGDFYNGWDPTYQRVLNEDCLYRYAALQNWSGTPSWCKTKNNHNNMAPPVTHCDAAEDGTDAFSDNDEDGYKNYSADAQCSSANDLTESWVE